jgi:hypothetical protein
METPALRPAGFAPRMNVLGVVLEAGPLTAPTTNQFDPAGVAVEAVTEYVAASPVLVTLTI